MAKSEIDTIMERSVMRNQLARQRLEVSRQRKANRLKTPPSARALNKTWHTLHSSLVEASTTLSYINVGLEPRLKTKLHEVQSAMRATLSNIQTNNITRIAKTNIRLELAQTINSLVGVQHGLSNNSIKLTAVQTVISNLSDKLFRLADQIVSKVNYENILVQNAEYEQLQDDLASAKKRALAAVDNMPIEKLKKASWSEALAFVKDTSEEHIKKLELKVQSAKAPVDKQSYQVHEEEQLRSMFKQFKENEAAMKAAINKSGITSSPDLDFVIMRGPVTVRTSPQIKEAALTAARVTYKVARFPGIRYGGNPEPWIGKPEFIPNMFVLENQVLVAIRTNPVSLPEEEVKKVKKGDKNLPKIRKPKPLKSKLNLDLLRQDVFDIIEARTGKKYIDVLKEADAKVKAIVNKAFPGFKFIWLIPNSVYQKIGPFSLDEVGLPF